MSTTTQVKKVKINKMSKARYGQTTPVATELYMLTDVLDPQYDVLPTADEKYAGQITQYTGETGGGLTNGYFYKCAAQGTEPETYAWEQTNVQPGGSGGAVDSVNGKTGTVVLGAADIDTTFDSKQVNVENVLNVLNDNIKQVATDLANQIDDSSIDLNHTWSSSKLNSIIGNKNAFSKIEKQTEYLYNVIYNNLDYDKAYEYMEQFKPTTFNATKLSAFLKSNPQVPAGGCSAVRRGNLFGKNLDWYFSDLAEFVIFARADKMFKSMGLGGNLTGLTNDVAGDVVRNGTYNEKFDILPFMQNGGINEEGVFVTANVVPIETEEDVFNRTTGTHEGEGKQDLCGLMIPRVILDNCKTAQEAVELISDEFNVFMPYKVDPKTGEYLFAQELHFIVGDGTETYLLEFINNEAVYTLMSETVVGQTTKLPYMTNFHLTNVQLQPSSSMIDWNTVEAYGQGLERFDTISSGYNGLNTREDMQGLLQRIIFTKAYTDYDDVGYHLPRWKTEFTGNFETFGSLTISDSQASFREIFAYVEDQFAHRDRETANTWQTEHTEVYNVSAKKLYLNVQENYSNTYEYDIAYEIEEETVKGVEVVDVLPSIADAKDGVLYLVNKPKVASYDSADRAMSGEEVYLKHNNYMGFPTTITLNTGTWCYDVSVDIPGSPLQLSMPLFLFDYDKIHDSEIGALFEVVEDPTEADFHCFYNDSIESPGNNMILPIGVVPGDISSVAYFRLDVSDLTVDTESNTFYVDGVTYQLNADEYSCWDYLFRQAMNSNFISSSESEATFVVNHNKRIVEPHHIQFCYAVAVHSEAISYGKSALLRGNVFEEFNLSPKAAFSLPDLSITTANEEKTPVSVAFVKELYDYIRQSLSFATIYSSASTTDPAGRVLPTVLVDDLLGLKNINCRIVYRDAHSAVEQVEHIYNCYHKITRDKDEVEFYFSAPDYNLKYTVDVKERTVTCEALPLGVEIDDSSTAVDKAWSASKLNTMIGNVEALLANI